MIGKRRLLYILISSAFMMLVGVIGFVFLENLSFFDSLWLTVISVLTVGYGDVVPKTEAGKIFTLILIPMAIGIVTYTLSAIAAGMLENQFSTKLWRKRMENKVAKLKNHFILCGYGRVGSEVLHQLLSDKQDIVLIDKDETLISELPEHVHIIIGDATDDEVLKRAGINQASGLITTLPNDADNVFVTLTAKGVNEAIHIVSRAEKQASEEKLYRAGATKVINPSSIGGRRMALSIVKPASVEYVDTVFQVKNERFHLEEIYVNEHSKLVNKTVGATNVRAKYGVTIVAIKRDDRLINSPSAQETFLPNDLLIVFGLKEDLDSFEQDL